MTRLLLCLFLLLPFRLSAQIVTFRSGEHEDFSRLVLAVPEGVAWSLGRVDDGYGLTLEPAPDGFDLSGAFARIPRTRLDEIRVTDNGLAFKLSCEDCHATAFLFRSNRLVIDIVDGDPPEASAFEQRISGFDPNRDEPETRPASDGPAGLQLSTLQEPLTPRRQQPAVSDESTVVAGDRGPAPPPATAPSSDEPGSLPASPELTAAAPFLLPSPVERAFETSDQVREMEEALVEGLARAASQGLLTPTEPLTIARTPDQSDDPPALPQPQSNQGPAGPGMPGIAARTSIDRDQPNQPRTALTNQGEACLDESSFNVASWADGRDMPLQLAEHRANLTRETGEFDEDALLSLARFYIHFGFGLEALSVLDQTRSSASQTDLLAVMARIVDDIPPKSRLLAGQEDCPSDVALWSVLASSNALDGAAADPVSVIQTLRRLPDPLRGHLGQRLAAIFAELGDADTAEALLTVAQGGLTAEGQDKVIVEASIADHSGETDRAIRQLTDLAEDEAYLSPDTLRELLELSIESGGPVPEDVIARSEIMRFEQNRYPIVVSELLELEIRAWLVNGAHDRVIALVEDAEELPEELRMSLMSDAVSGITDGASDDAFLNFSYGQVPMVTAEVENKMARRLIALGFYDRAGEILRAAARRETARERRYLEAEIALGLGNPEQVEVILSGMTDEQALALRIEALSDLGEHQAAWVLSQSASSQEAPLLAWRAEEWAQLAAADSGPVSSIAVERVGVERPEPQNLPPLAQRRQLIDSSEGTRQLVLDLLGTFPATPNPEVPIQ